MRFPKEFGQRTKKPMEVKRKYILIYEGEETERQYFDGIKDNGIDIGISSLIEIKPLLRSYNERNWSNPKKIINQIIKHLSENTLVGISIHALVERINDYLIEELEITDDSIWNVKTIEKSLYDIIDQKFALKKEDIVTDIVSIIVTISDYLNTNLNIAKAAEKIENYVKNQDVVYEKGFDRICLIVDRDRQSFFEEQYSYVLNTCCEKGFNLFVSNPCFEFWLLLHFSDIKSLKSEDILANNKVTAKKRFVEQELCNRLKGYKKGSIKFDKIKNSIDLAIKQEKDYCENIEKLESELGSNVGLLIAELKQ